ncbi:MAG TPA: CpaD family pilus assembly lipoprotein [Reyranella sp.]|jgi:type IV pilus biogenesis protein CpaD/CtpE|nr:CpaD family pilus assembly lipoprotein [Reyranella sp.]
MRSAVLLLLAAASIAACTDPVAQQAAVDTRHDPVRADTMLAVSFAPGVGRLGPGQVNELRAMVSAGRRAQRDEFVVVTDGTGGALQSLRAQQVRASLSNAGARWVGVSTEPAMAMGPDQVVVVRSEYRIAERNCPNYNPTGIANSNEALMPGFGCADAYNFGQMLARPRDAAVGRNPGPAEASVNADAIQRYREGRVRVSTAVSTTGGTGGGTGGGGAGGGGGGTPPAPSN